MNLSNANLANALFDHQTVFSAQNPATGQQIAANLSNTLGSGANLMGIASNADMRGVNLAGAHLSTAGFTGLFDQTTIFSITNPATGANVGANLFGSGANMTGTPLQNADFRGANLAGVNLSNADLTNAQFNEFTIFSATPQGGGTQQAVNLLGTGADLSGCLLYTSPSPRDA